MTTRRTLVRQIAAIATLLLGLAAGSQAMAQSVAGQKLSADLQAQLACSPGNCAVVPRAKRLGTQLHLKVLINAASADATLAALRQDIVARGGSIFYNYLAVRGLSAMVPATALPALAARSDVVGIAPNRTTTRHASLLQLASGSEAVRAPSGGGMGLDGAGVGIAILDSGIDWRHQNAWHAAGKTRVRALVDLVAFGRAAKESWAKGLDYSTSVRESLDGVKYKADNKKYVPITDRPDPYGHGSHVAAVAAGSGAYQLPDPSGVARAARGATAAGIVVVAGGNAGRNAAGQAVLGNITSPGHEPSVITVGAANLFRTTSRSADAVTRFSSRGPTRCAYSFASGHRWTDNLIKPDLVAPGNRVVAMLGAERNESPAAWNYLARAYPQLTQVPGAAQLPRHRLMELSGTSVAAPVVAGTLALLLQANPGLTPPLVKAILQYTAQPLPQGGAVEQGTGMLNVEGAMRMAGALRTDLGPALTAGTHLMGGDALFTRRQPIYDLALLWARGIVLRTTVTYLPVSQDLPANTLPASIIERSAPQQTLLTAGVKVLDSLALSPSSAAAALLTPVPTLASRAAAGVV